MFIYSPQEAKTLQSPVVFQGIGLHSGQASIIRLLPWDSSYQDHGNLFFNVVDSMESSSLGVIVPVGQFFVTKTQFCTCLEANGKIVMTIEHLMSALAYLGITHARIDIVGVEVPILDGSALPFVEALESKVASFHLKGYSRPEVLVRKPIVVFDSEHSESLSHLSSLSLPAVLDLIASNDSMPRFCGFWPGEVAMHCFIDFNHTMIQKQFLTFVPNKDDYRSQIAPCATFGFLNQLASLNQKGLAKGASKDNVVVLTESTILNPEKFLFFDNFVRHKILDAIGDLFILGANMHGTFVGYKPSHSLHAQLLRAVVAEGEWVSATSSRSIRA